MSEEELHKDPSLPLWQRQRAWRMMKEEALAAMRLLDEDDGRPKDGIVLKFPQKPQKNGTEP